MDDKDADSGEDLPTSGIYALPSRATVATLYASLEPLLRPSPELLSQDRHIEHLEYALHEAKLKRLGSRVKAPKTPRIPAQDSDVMESAVVAALDARIQALPQELQDEILHHTLLATLPKQHKISWSEDLQKHEVLPGMIGLHFSISTGFTSLYEAKTGEPDAYDGELGHTFDEVSADVPGGNVTIVDLRYKCPTALQINSKLRDAMAKNFYSNTVFMFSGWRKACFSWYRNIPLEHSELTRVFVPRDW